jgi:arginine-tRNA-protein transferase
VTRLFPTRPLQFYLTAPTSCPYLPGRLERKVFAHLDSVDGAALNDALTHAGFRRSQGIIYRPACEACEACLSARVVVADFRPSRSQRRVTARNADLVHTLINPEPSEEQFQLLTRYLGSRHANGGMAGMGFADYAMMVADTPADTRISEYRSPDDGRLIAAALVDRLSDGASLVYSFFDPDEAKRSLGGFMILDQIARTRVEGAAYVYLGYWVPGSAKMDYKARFQPLEVLRRGGWRRLSAVEAQAHVEPEGRRVPIRATPALPNDPSGLFRRRRGF